MVAYNNKKFYIDIIETKPAPAISIIETDCEVDFAPPLDYKEPERSVPSVASSKAPAEGLCLILPLAVLFYSLIYLFAKLSHDCLSILYGWILLKIVVLSFSVCLRYDRYLLYYLNTLCQIRHGSPLKKQSRCFRIISNGSYYIVFLIFKILNCSLHYYHRCT